MGTTTLVVELLIVGAGAALGFVLLVVALLGNAWLAYFADLGIAGTTLLAVPFLYVLGIVVDRAADSILDRFAGRGLDTHFGGDREAARAARRRATVEAAAFDRLEYTRSRMRVVRGWTLNALLITPAATVAVLTADTESHGHRARAVAVVLFSGVALAASCFLSFRSLRGKEYEQLRQYADDRSPAVASASIDGVARQSSG